MTTTRPAATPGSEPVTSRILPTDAPSAATSPASTPKPDMPKASPGLTSPSQADSQANDQSDDQACLDLRAVITAARDARHFATARMTAWGLPPDAILHAKTIVSELVTNAYQAARSAGTTGYISLTLLRLPGQLMIEVSDHDPGQPVQSYATDDAENGRGLLMVEALSQEWGVRPKPSGGKTVYAITRIPP